MLTHATHSRLTLLPPPTPPVLPFRAQDFRQVAHVGGETLARSLEKLQTRVDHSKKNATDKQVGG